MHRLSRTDWSDHLRSLAEPVLADTPLAEGWWGDAAAFVEGFADERGDRRAVDRPLLAWMVGADPGPPPPLTPRGVDLRLWWTLHRGDRIDSVIAPGPGPLVGRTAFESGAIETTTEIELGALHALGHHATRDRRWMARCLDAARWHVEFLQPDNGTNHPWAVHVFVWLAMTETDESRAGEAALHAETLVHNALVASGRPDRFSACLLLDAARALA
ncbi:MAG: hypothetical protein H6810_01410 [Phycisphaeraceae bacterium]|nr:MAG: hypothetical protein H6810_01410 [Phycisphaeraceae bacterium]